MFNAKHLALRDTALAALVGAVASAEFGAEFGDDFGDDFGADEFAGEFGDDFGADAPVAAPRPTPQQALAAWRAHSTKMANAKKRVRMLDPNGDSAVKVERYIFGLSQSVTLGAATALALTGQPDVTIRPQRVVSNSPVPGFASLSVLQVSNVSVSIGAGAVDAFFFNANGVGVSLDMPTISPAQRATATGTTTTLVPPGYVQGAAYLFSLAFIGPSKMAG